ncbi:hypothetical protein RRG08_052395 [Elysia crispata]|uniref:Uncharacterized protein n=1 Tax=Elysia crispata TaxID=231223 RepID=A0AAE1B177_9GAST|nr:hypothetical protein RRG08_052395 [Elysia crispata]
MIILWSAQLSSGVLGLPSAFHALFTFPRYIASVGEWVVQEQFKTRGLYLELLQSRRNKEHWGKTTSPQYFGSLHPLNGSRTRISCRCLASTSVRPGSTAHPGAPGYVRLGEPMAIVSYSTAHLVARGCVRLGKPIVSYSSAHPGAPG